MRHCIWNVLVVVEPYSSNHIEVLGFENYLQVRPNIIAFYYIHALNCVKLKIHRIIIKIIILYKYIQRPVALLS